MPIAELTQEELDTINKRLTDIEGLLKLANRRYLGIMFALKLKDPEILNIAEVNSEVEGIKNSIEGISKRVTDVEKIVIPAEPIIIKP